MSSAQATRARLLAHAAAYPLLGVSDVFKFLHQSSFGCEHAVVSVEFAEEKIDAEFSSLKECDAPLVEELDGNYCRVHLSVLKEGISPETLARLFVLSAKSEDGLDALREKLAVARALAQEGVFAFGVREFDEALCAWEADGFCALHHSAAFREAYHPAYRVVAKDFALFLPLFAKIDSRRAQGVVAIDGGSAAGKTTLGSLLSKVYNCTLFHMDDFFLPPHLRTEARLKEVGGNVDRARYLAEILTPLSRGEDVCYRRFDCSVMAFGDVQRVCVKPLVIVEGAYSMHPELVSYYDLTVFLDVDKDVQKTRILKRNTKDFAARFFGEWIPMEDRYFEQSGIRRRADLVFCVL